MPQAAGAEPELIDLHHLGRARVIGAWVVGEVIVDPGPGSCLDALLAGLGTRAPRALALTHIHLDHAGACGSLLARFPDCEVWVHERGAPHLVDPSRLLDSATRLYGSRMERLWGEVAPVPAQRIRVLRGGERLGPFEVAYTPGHASHHVCYLHTLTGTVFAGDLLGVRIGDGPVLAPTPPPDIDLDAWRASLELVERWRPRRFAITHCGAFADAEAHLTGMRERLREVRTLAGELDEARFAEAVRAGLSAAVDGDTAAAYLQATSPEQGYKGLRRYLERRDNGA